MPPCIDVEVKNAWSSLDKSPAPPITFARKANAYALKSGPNDLCKRFEDIWTVVGAGTDLDRCGSSGRIVPGVLACVV